MSWLQSIALGIVQGFTEFLPISSSAHLVLTRYFLGWDDPGLAYDVALHLGTLAAILVFFREDWIGLLKSPLDHRRRPNLFLIAAASVPAAVFGLLFEKKIEEAFRSPILIAGTLSIFAILLFVADTRSKRNRTLSDVGYKDALWIGLAQALAIVPGVSRAGITITMGLFLGLARDAGARFSFLMSAPIVAGAGVLKAKHIVHALAAGGAEAGNIMIGFSASVVSGLAALGMLYYILRSRSFLPFVVYRLALALVIVVVFVVR